MEEKSHITNGGPDNTGSRAASVNGLLDSKDPERTLTSSPEDAITYPNGFTFALVVLALMLSMFLVALDMVSSTDQ
jgi:hypothetical protein